MDKTVLDIMYYSIELSGRLYKCTPYGKFKCYCYFYHVNYNDVKSYSIIYRAKSVNNTRHSYSNL